MASWPVRIEHSHPCDAQPRTRSSAQRERDCSTLNSEINDSSPQQEQSIVRGTKWRKYDRRSGAPPVKLSLGREGLAMVFDVCLGRFRSVVHCMLLVSAS